VLRELIEQDIALFHSINELNLPHWISEMLIWSRQPLTWVPIYIFLIAFIVFNYTHEKWRMLLYAIGSVALSDIISAKILKPTIGRLRPCHVGFDMIDRVGCSGLFSFTSNHAANHFALATFLILLLGRDFPWIKIPLLIWAGWISFAQVYVGVHYPLDVFFGALLGILVSFFTYKLYCKV